MADQLSLLEWAATAPAALFEPPPAPVVTLKPEPPAIAAGKAVQFEGRGLFRVGILRSPGVNGIALVDVGTHTPLPVAVDQLRPYDGPVQVWRLVVELACDRPDCQPVQGLGAEVLRKTSFARCGICEARPRCLWRYSGTMALSPNDLPPLRWPDAVWFPAGMDPNHRGES